MSNTAKHGTDLRNQTRTNTDRKHVASPLNTAQHNCARYHRPHVRMRVSDLLANVIWVRELGLISELHHAGSGKVSLDKFDLHANSLHTNDSNALHLVATNSAMEQKLSAENIENESNSMLPLVQFPHTQHVTKTTPQLKSQNRITNQQKHITNINISYQKTTQTHMAHARLHAVNN